MAEGYTSLSVESLKKSDGVSELNRMLQLLFENIFGNTVDVKHFTGYGSPEGVVAANVGSLYQRLDGTTGLVVYVKESGTNAQGWNPITTGGSGFSLVGSAKGNLFFVNSDIDGNLFIDQLPIGTTGYVLTSDGILPYWDFVGAGPGAVTLLQTTKVIYVSSGYESEFILMNKTATGTASITTLNNDDFTSDEATASTSSAQDIITMDETSDTTVSPTLEHGEVVA